MSITLAKRTGRKQLCRRIGGSFAAIAMLVASGCQAWSPVGSPLALGALGQDAHIRKLAAQDKFPTPADVGMSSQ